MQDILLGTSQWSFTCENTVWIQPLAACTKPQGESTLKRYKVQRLDSNPQNQTQGAALGLAELVEPRTPPHLSPFGRQEVCPRAGAKGAQWSALVMRGSRGLGEAQIPFQKTEWERKIWSISWRRQKKVIDALEASVHQDSVLILTFYSYASFCVPKFYLNAHLTSVHKAPNIPHYPLQWIPGIHFHKLSVSLISAPQQVSEMYTTVCPFSFTRFSVNLERWEENYSCSYVIPIFIFFFSGPWICFCGLV